MRQGAKGWAAPCTLRRAGQKWRSLLAQGGSSPGQAVKIPVSGSMFAVRVILLQRYKVCPPARPISAPCPRFPRVHVWNGCLVGRTHTFRPCPAPPHTRRYGGVNNSDYPIRHPCTPPTKIAQPHGREAGQPLRTRRRQTRTQSAAAGPSCDQASRGPAHPR